jgi:hypothetical protein
LRDIVIFTNPDPFPSGETGVNPEMRTRETIHLNDLEVRKPLVVSASQISEKRRIMNLVWNFTIPNLSLKAVS